MNDGWIGRQAPFQFSRGASQQASTPSIHCCLSRFRLQQEFKGEKIVIPVEVVVRFVPVRSAFADSGLCRFLRSLMMMPFRGGGGPLTRYARRVTRRSSHHMHALC